MKTGIPLTRALGNVCTSFDLSTFFLVTKSYGTDCLAINIMQPIGWPHNDSDNSGSDGG